MFEGPEYASYVELCRALRLEREFEEGDWYVSFAGYVSPTLPGTPMLVTKSELRLMAALKSPERTAGLIWLPRLDQWVARIRAEDVVNIEITHDPQDPAVHIVRGYRGGPWRGRAPEGRAPTDEEAAARCWCVAAGREVPGG